MTDYDCLQSFIRSRDEQAFATIVHRHKPMVYRVCRDRLGNHDDALDATQQVFTKLYVGADKIQFNLAAWLRRCASNTAISLLRSDIARRNREMQWDGNPIDNEDSLETDEVESILHECLSRLTVRDREWIEKYVIEEKTQSSIALKAGVSQQAVAKRLAKIKSILRGELIRRGIASLGTVLAAVLPGRVAQASILKIAATVEGTKSAKSVAAAAVLITAASLPVSQSHHQIHPTPPQPQSTDSTHSKPDPASHQVAAEPVTPSLFRIAHSNHSKPPRVRIATYPVKTAKRTSPQITRYGDMYTVTTPPEPRRAASRHVLPALAPPHTFLNHSRSAPFTPNLLSRNNSTRSTESSNYKNDNTASILNDFVSASSLEFKHAEIVVDIRNLTFIDDWIGRHGYLAMPPNFIQLIRADSDRDSTIPGTIDIKSTRASIHVGDAGFLFIPGHYLAGNTVTIDFEPWQISFADRAMARMTHLPDAFDIENVGFFSKQPVVETWLLRNTSKPNSLAFSGAMDREISMPHWNTRQGSAWINSADTLLVSGKSSKGVTINGDNITDYQSLARRSEYDSVGLMTWNGGFASGVYIGNGWILTAAHVAENSSDLSFTIGGKVYRSHEIYIHDNWTGDAANGNDLALIKITGDVSDLEAAKLYNEMITQSTGDLIGSETTFVGYDRPDENRNDSSEKRAGQNVIDAFGGDHESLRSYSDDLFFVDLDDPEAASDGYSWSVDEALDLERLIAPGDSGGGVFIERNGETYLIGINSFLLTHDGTFDADYGDLAGLTYVPAYHGWIHTITGLGSNVGTLTPINRIPEPSTLVLLASVFMLVMKRSHRP